MRHEAITPDWPRFSRFTFPAAVRADELVFLSGMTAVDEATGQLVGEGDVVAQTRFIYRKMREVLEAAGGSLDDVVFTRDYVVGTENYAGTAAVRREVFGPTFPAATGVIVAGLLRPGALIEIDAIAVSRRAHSAG
jgi:enamine deaminase RidA (YjgF/YER057c/UK114 family)